ncbi:MAG: hypothetical protein ACYDGN_06410 [Acidimicrobiales bacterium]
MRIDGPLRGETTRAGNQPDADPESSCWERRFEADVTRLEELIELYTSLGYEVRTEDLVPAAFAPECEGCALGACRSYVALYTRRPASKS